MAFLSDVILKSMAGRVAFGAGMTVVIVMSGCSDERTLSMSNPESRADDVRMTTSSDDSGDSTYEHAKYLQRIRIRSEQVLAGLKAKRVSPKYELKTLPIRQLVPMANDFVLADAGSGLSRQLIKWKMNDGSCRKSNVNDEFIVGSVLIPSIGKSLRYVSAGGGSYKCIVEGMEADSEIVLEVRHAKGYPARLSCSSGANVILCKTPDGSQLWSDEPTWAARDLTGFGNLFEAAAVHPDGKWIAQTRNQIHVEVKMIAGDTVMLDVPESSTFDVQHLEFDSSGQFLAAGGEEDGIGERIRVWKWRENRITFDSKGPGRAVEWMVFSRSGELLATANSDSIVTIWDLTTDKILSQFLVNGAITGGMTFDLDDEMIIVGCDQGLKAFDLDYDVRKRK